MICKTKSAVFDASVNGIGSAFGTGTTQEVLDRRVVIKSCSVGVMVQSRNIVPIFQLFIALGLSLHCRARRPAILAFFL